MSQDILPDSRLTHPKGAQNLAGAWWVPLFCANCGADGGFVPEENMTFAFYLCDPCAERYGEIAGLYFMPDELFGEKLKQEQLSTYGRFLNEEELLKIVEADASPLATLIKQRR